MIKDWYARQSWEIRMLIAAGAFAFLPVTLLSLRGDATAPNADGPEKAESSVDTFIPKGFVLVPIEVANYEALDSILGKYGVVDLHQSGQVIARNVRILRAPQNPSHFAVLIREFDTDRILRLGGAFHVVLKRPEKVGTEFVKSTPIKRRKIVYDGGS